MPNFYWWCLSLFWAPCALLANLKCKKMIVNRMTFIQANQEACYARTFIFQIFDLFRHSFDLSLSLRYVSCRHCLLFYKSICVVSTSSVRFSGCWLKCHSPSSLLNRHPAGCWGWGLPLWGYLKSPGARALTSRPFSAVYFLWVFASFQLNKLCTYVNFH